MNVKKVVTFSTYRLDVENEQLWKGKRSIPLRPKSFSVLCYLIERSDQLVTKDELLDRVWPDSYVVEAVLKDCVREIREALGDDAQKSRFIKTVYRRGYRFIASVQHGEPTGQPKKPVESSVTSSTSVPTDFPAASFFSHHTSPAYIVGRENELNQLQTFLDRALAGERQVVFVTGEPGIGKTTLVDGFVSSLEGRPNVWIGRGQCIEHYGEGDAYLPIFEAIRQLSRYDEKEQFVSFLGRYAPTWLAQMPALIDETKQAALQQKVQGATRQRMLREMAEAIEVRTGAAADINPLLLVLVLEDLHWSDYSTLDLISTLAQRREPARLLVIGTYRPMDLIIRKHPLKSVKQELQRRAQCHEIILDGLATDAVRAYLTQRFPESPLPATLAEVLQQRTEGSPFFLVTLLSEWVERGVLKQINGAWELDKGLGTVAASVPGSILQMIELQIDRLTPQEQYVMEAAGVAGAEFSAASVAAGIMADTGQVEECCESLARRHLFLKPTGTSQWPDGTVAASYHFLHALHHKTWYDRVPAARRRQLHLEIGKREERAYATREEERAAALAVHFEEGGQGLKALHYRWQASITAMQGQAYQEAITHLNKGRQFLPTIPDGPERQQTELTLQMARGTALIATKGYGDSAVKESYIRARELCQELGTLPIQALWGLQAFHFMRGDLHEAYQLGEECFQLAQQTQKPAHLLQAHWTMGQTLFHLGKLPRSLEYLEQGLEIYDPKRHRPGAVQDPGVMCLNYAACDYWTLGYPDQALERVQQAVALAQQIAHPFSEAVARNYLANVCIMCGQWQTGQEEAAAAVALCQYHGFPVWSAYGAILNGVALIAQDTDADRLRQMRRGIRAWEATGAKISVPLMLGMFSQACLLVGAWQEGLQTIDKAISTVQETQDCYYEAELYRLKGELLLQSETGRRTTPIAQQAEACFEQSLDIARQQQAKSWELRTAISLGRLWSTRRKEKEARSLLHDIYSWFTEGFDTEDLRHAKVLLDTWK